MTELERIEKNNKAELPEKTKMVITIKDVLNPSEVLLKTKEVMRIISQYAYTNAWPANNEWDKLLPKWFVESMTLKSDEDILNDKNQWDFESWIEGMYNRAWVWWSSEIRDNTIVVIIETLNIPYSFEPLLYIFYAQGIKMENIKVHDDIYDES